MDTKSPSPILCNYVKSPISNPAVREGLNGGTRHATRIANHMDNSRSGKARANLRQPEDVRRRLFAPSNFSLARRERSQNRMHHLRIASSTRKVRQQVRF